MKTTALCVLVVLGFLAGQSSSHDVFSRWRRQALNCQPGDDACQKCSSGCHALSSSQLPECCEAYNACCDEYFEACKTCSNSLSKDPYFPEYCCASFTSCCDLITTFTADVKGEVSLVVANSCTLTDVTSQVLVCCALLLPWTGCQMYAFSTFFRLTTSIPLLGLLLQPINS